MPIPEAKEVMGDETEVRVSWLVGISQELRKKVELYIAYFSNASDEIRIGQGNQVTFVAIPRKNDVNKYSSELESWIKKVYEKINPDVVHVFGTEFPHTLSVLHASEQTNRLEQTVVSIQGLAYLCAAHYLAGLSHDVCKAYTIRDVLRHSNIYGAKKQFEKKGMYEVESLKKVKHVIGRTDFDYAGTTMINPKIKYHFNNEILRDSFYKKNWSYENCESHRIFMSQGGVPYKGFHFAIQAMALLKQQYPDVCLYITERDFVHAKTFSQKIRINSYQRYLKQLIEEYQLDKNIVFLGTLNEEQMCEQYLRANVYILPSVIENSPNSLGEALLLGVPSVSADAGGVKNMMTHNEDGLIYPHDDSNMLAAYIAKLFEDKELCENFSRNAKRHAGEIFNREKNIRQLMNIYEELYVK